LSFPPESRWGWILLALALLAAWELVRWLVFRAIRRRVERRVLRLLHTKRIRLDRYKLANKSYVKAEILADPPIHHAVEERAAADDVPVEVVRRDVEDWVDEIVPAFSFVTYYELGKRIARWALSLVYEVAVDRASQVRMADALEGGAVPVFVMNHRSNADYVVATHVLMKQTAISYAVGEWARVWPLDSLFRSFGAYFVRRGFRDPLYHLVLRRYVQLAAKRGVTQGIFPEGRLTRDGFIGPAKIGLIDAFVELCLDPEFDRDFLLVPVGLNFDRVLEDTTLLGEARRGKAPGGILSRLRSLASLFVRGPITLAQNGLRLLFGRTRRHGHAAVAFGDPISLRSLFEKDHVDIHAMSPDDRKAWLKSLGARVMEAIGRVVPATPVPVVAEAARRLGMGTFERDRLRAAVATVLDDVRRSDAPVVLGRVGARVKGARRKLERDRDARSAGTKELEDALLDDEEAEAVVAAGLDILRRRRVLRLQHDRITVRRAEVVAYYAASIAQHLRRDVVA
jgi:glycerol-3-phosphate O-acyltransferase